MPVGRLPPRLSFPPLHVEYLLIPIPPLFPPHSPSQDLDSLLDATNSLPVRLPVESLLRDRKAAVTNWRDRARAAMIGRRRSSASANGISEEERGVWTQLLKEGAELQVEGGSAAGDACHTRGVHAVWLRLLPPSSLACVQGSTAVWLPCSLSGGGSSGPQHTLVA